MKFKFAATNTMFKFFSALLIGLFIYNISYAQVTIAPTNLFINDESRFGTFIVINGSTNPQEVNIDFEFSYGATKNDGSRIIVKDSTESFFSITDYVRAFPKQFIVQPGQRQVIRLRINAPNNLNDGTYWTRIKTSSSAVTSPIEIQNQSNVSAQVGIKVEQVTGLFYKVGDVRTEISLHDIAIERKNINGIPHISALVDFKRSGNSPFLGTIKTEIVNKDNKVIKSQIVSTSYYFTGTHLSEVDITDLKSGDYNLRVTFNNNRSDINDSELIPMTPVSKTIPITL